MKSREVVTKDNYKQIVLKRMIILCWILLAVCFVVKIFGGNFFNIVCQNERFIKVCDYVDNSQTYKIIIGFVSNLLCNSLFYLSICRKIKFTRIEFVIVVICSAISVVLKVSLRSLSVIIDIIMLFVLPFIFKRSNGVKCTKWFIRSMLFANFFNLLFQIISAIVKNVAVITIESKATLILLIYSIDCYIMLLLYYLCINIVKENKRMSWIMEWLWGKSPKQLEKMKANRIAKRAKIDQEIAEINAELDKQRNENK
jgi:hypothetical protein